jgi:hypothetical protein
MVLKNASSLFFTPLTHERALKPQSQHTYAFGQV